MFCRKLILGAVMGMSMNAVNAAGFVPSVPVADLELFFGAAPGAISAISPSADPATEGSGIIITDSFSFQAGDILSFDYNFMTNERPGGLDDYAFVSFGGNLSFLDHAQDTAPGYYVPSVAPYQEETGYKNFSYIAPATGIFEFGVGVVDAWDEWVETGLLIDNFTVIRNDAEVHSNSFETGELVGIGDASIVDVFFGTPPTDGGFQVLVTTAPSPVPLPPAVWLLFSGMGALLAFSRRKHG